MAGTIEWAPGAGPWEKYPRGETPVGHTGWVAWIDDNSRDVHCQEGRCVRVVGSLRSSISGHFRAAVEIQTNDREHMLTVPHGRLQWNATAALDALAADIREEGERQIQGIQQEILRAQQRMGEVTRGMMLHLVAVEVAKASGGARQDTGKHLEQAVKRLGGPDGQ